MKKLIFTCFALSALLLLFMPSPSHADITVSIVNNTYANGLSVTDKILKIIVSVTSTFSINSVTADVEGRTATLTYTQNAYNVNSGTLGPAWVGTIDLSGLTEDIKTITITATEAYGSVGTTTANFVYDNKPTVSVIEPLDYSFAPPTIRVRATCLDTKGDCTNLLVKYGSTVLATGTTSLDQIVSLSAYNGQQISIDIVGTDNAAQTTTITRSIHVESSGRLTKVADVPGMIWDYGADGRVLYLDTSNGGNALKIKDTVGSATITVFDTPDKIPHDGLLTPKGVMFQEYITRSGKLYDFRSGNAEIVGFPAPINSPKGYPMSIPKVKENYAAWYEQHDVTSYDIHLRELTYGISTVVADLNEQPQIDLSASGDIVYRSNYNIFHINSGVKTQITNDLGYNSGGSLWYYNIYPKTDGINIVYTKTEVLGFVTKSSIYIQTNSQEVQLTPFFVNADYQYELNNGWIAYTMPGTTFEDQIWLRSPSGTTEQATFFSSSSEILALAPNGELLFRNGDRCYSYQRGESLTELSATLLKPIYANNKWYTIIDRSVFSLNTSPNPPDTTLPVITSFTLPARSTSLTVAISALTATDNDTIAGFCLTETNSSTGCIWNDSAPSQYVFSSQGNKTLYAFAKDATGNVSQAVSSTVTVDLSIPVTTGTNPAANATNYSGNVITVTFNETMDASTINGSTFIVRSGSTTVAGAMSYNASTKTATFTPSSPLSSSTNYIVTLTTGIKDAAGNPLGAISTWNFTTASLQSYTVTSGSTAGGLITPVGSQSVKQNNTAIFTITPAPGYMAVGVMGSCGGTLNGKTYTTQDVVADCTVGALFAKADVTFDEDSYLAANADVAAAVKSGGFSSGWQHYSTFGSKEGRSLSPADYGSFNENAYLAANTDVAAAVKAGYFLSGWQHYSIFGKAEGRAVQPSGYQNFSEDAYLAANADVAGVVKAGSMKSGWDHYSRFGKNEGRALSPTNYGTFKEDAYLAANPDVASGVHVGWLDSAWVHYANWGKKEGRSVAPPGYVIYNESAYLAANPDVAATVKSGSYSSGWEHYAKYGKNEGRSLAPAGYGLFNEYAYLAANPDVAGGVRDGWLSSGWAHYSNWGKNEGRSLNPPNYGSFNEGDYLAANFDVHRAVLDGGYLSGWQHYQQNGKSEGRPLTLGSLQK